MDPLHLQEGEREGKDGTDSGYSGRILGRVPSRQLTITLPKRLAEAPPSTRLQMVRRVEEVAGLFALVVSQGS